MARFFGKVGYGEPTETAPGVWEDRIVEVEYQGDVQRSHRKLEGEDVLQDVQVLNAISIVADDRAMAHFFRIKYVIWQDVYWTVASVEVRAPRLILTLGGVYNGPKA
jgi:hypothetical protein